MHSMQNNATRLWDTLLETANFGGTSNGGITRLALTDEDRAVRYSSSTIRHGCTISNLPASRPSLEHAAAAYGATTATKQLAPASHGFTHLNHRPETKIVYQ